jgi:hypothetical protein
MQFFGPLASAASLAGSSLLGALWGQPAAHLAASDGVGPLRLTPNAGARVHHRTIRLSARVSRRRPIGASAARVVISLKGARQLDAWTQTQARHTMPDATIDSASFRPFTISK